MPVRHRTTTLLAAALALTALLPAATAQAAPAGADATTHRPDAAAAGWLARQLVDGEHFEATFNGVTYPDQGLTVDAVLALAASRTGDQYATKATTWLAKPESSPATSATAPPRRTPAPRPSSCSPPRSAAATRPPSAGSTSPPGCAPCRAPADASPTAPSGATTATPSASPSP
ncbi:hypothetical protein [Kitasatospora sp. NPDC050543]|uniref:hypothetical protein n=1 Tax=Kitasatospora sp. NPDC050543 TaxID=3364054 RepID=UPI0037BDEF2F